MGHLGMLTTDKEVGRERLYGLIQYMKWVTRIPPQFTDGLNHFDQTLSCLPCELTKDPFISNVRPRIPFGQGLALPFPHTGVKIPVREK